LTILAPDGGEVPGALWRLNELLPARIDHLFQTGGVI
jgi:hypothetical protein